MEKAKCASCKSQGLTHTYQDTNFGKFVRQFNKQEIAAPEGKAYFCCTVCGWSRLLQIGKKDNVSRS